MLSCYTSAPKFMIKTFKAFVKPFEAPQRSVKVKFNLIFSICLDWEGKVQPAQNRNQTNRYLQKQQF